jgi:predicted thioesterase
MTFRLASGSLSIAANASVEGKRSIWRALHAFNRLFKTSFMVEVSIHASFVLASIDLDASATTSCGASVEASSIFSNGP